MPQSKATMCISPTRMVLVSPYLVADIHQHAIMQFTCSLDGSPFSVWTETGDWRKAAAVLIDSNVPHSVKDFTGWQATICIIPDARRGRMVKDKVLQGQCARYFEADEVQPILQTLKEKCENPVTDVATFHTIVDSVYNHLLGEEAFHPPLDTRIVSALRSIRANIHDTISAASLASEVHLSEHRFLHLFREQVGAPLRQYVLWQRVAAATQAFIEGRAAKEAAYEAGFSDPAHLSRTFTQMFGAQLSSFAPLRQLYQFGFFADA